MQPILSPKVVLRKLHNATSLIMLMFKTSEIYLSFVYHRKKISAFINITTCTCRYLIIVSYNVLFRTSNWPHFLYFERAQKTTGRVPMATPSLPSPPFVLISNFLKCVRLYCGANISIISIFLFQIEQIVVLKNPFIARQTIIYSCS